MSLMQRIPLHAKEVKVFKPECLHDQPEIPAFTLRAPTRQQREDMVYALREAGLRKHSDEAIREASIEELCRLWECDEHHEDIQKVRAYWQAVTEHAEEAANRLIEAENAKDAGEEAPPELAPFEHPDSAAIEELLERLDRRSERLRRMDTDNAKFSRAFPRYAIAHCVTGWTGMQAQPRFEDELLTLESVFEIEEELESRFGDLGSLAVAQLAGAAIGRLFLTKESEKNSASGPVSQQTPPSTKGTGSVSANGKSPASETSTETPAG